VRHAVRLARHLAGRGFRPGVVLCSSARRAVETLAPLRPRLPHDSTVCIEREIYLAGPSRLLERIGDVDERCTELLVIAHNPGLSELARLLCGSGPPEALARLRRGVPAGALAALGIERARWNELAPGAARLETFTAPEDLGAR
jgi:phosphohistidine phosphatase